MSEESQILTTTDKDIERLEKLIIGNSLRSMRIVLRKVERRITIYEDRLTEMYRNERILKARVYNNVDLLKIDSEYTAGKGKKNRPIQTFEFLRVDHDPHANLSYNKFNILTTEEGVRKLDAEINRINSDIKYLQAEIDKYKKKYKELKERLDKAEEDKEKRSKIGRFIAPTREDLIADEIAQAKMANVLLLLEINKEFINKSELLTLTQSENQTYGEFIQSLEGNVGYPDGDRRVGHQLEVYQQLFWSHGHSKGLTIKLEGTGEVVPLSLLLNFDNPGDTKNTEVLNTYVERARGAAKNTDKMSEQVDRYLKDVDSVIADPLVSKGVEIKPDEPITLNESMRADTISYPASVLRMGDFYHGSFELPTLFESVRKRWKKRHAKLYLGLPMCPNAKPSGTSTDMKEEEAYVAVAKERRLGSQEYREKLAAAEEIELEEIKISLGDLPDSAPEWVQIYVGKYKKAARGTIVYQGNQVVILRGTSIENAGVAKQRANAMTAFSPEEKMEEKNEYYYKSVIGWAYVSGKNILFTVSVEEMEKIEEGEYATYWDTKEKKPKRLKKAQIKMVEEALKTESSRLQEAKEFVAFVMWGKKT